MTDPSKSQRGRSVPGRSSLSAQGWYTSQSRFLTAAEVCKYLRISRATLYRLVKRRHILAFRVAKRDWRFSAAVLAEWVAGKSDPSGGKSGKVR